MEVDYEGLVGNLPLSYIHFKLLMPYFEKKKQKYGYKFLYVYFNVLMINLALS